MGFGNLLTVTQAVRFETWCISAETPQALTCGCCWKSPRFVSQEHGLQSPLKLPTSSVKQAAPPPPQRAADTRSQVLSSVPGASPHHRAAADTESCAQDPPPIMESFREPPFLRLGLPITPLPGSAPHHV